MPGLSPDQPSGRGFRAVLWIAQLLVGLPFVFFGSMKLVTPIPELAQIMPWTGELPEVFVRAISLVDIAGGLGMLLPALTRIRPGLTVAAAAGCALLQVCAIAFHLSRGEASAVPLNFVFLALSLFVWWGRRVKAPISPRGYVAAPAGNV